MNTSTALPRRVGADLAPGPGGASSTAALPLVLTQGDVCGIGPETLVQAHLAGALAHCVVVGDAQVLLRAARLLRRRDDVPDIVIARIGDTSELAQLPPGALAVIDPADVAARRNGAPSPPTHGPEAEPALHSLPFGQVRRQAGAAAAAAIRAAVALVQAGQAAALVTAPIHKEALALAGLPYPGHTEMLADLAGHAGAPCEVRMMLANDELKTVLVTVHCSLRQAIDRVTYEAVLATLRIGHTGAALWGQPRPRIAVAGLNPHAGEGGLFGDEEIRVIAPAIAAARAEGIDAFGPFAPDTVFMRARRGEFDLVVAQYHDQGLIPVKYLGVEQGVNVTLGLPFVRTSPDHGTAFDIAGTGRADPSSLIAAVAMARRFVQARA
jgi:4-hydroxythreonine-4-phosphate dehydrogenase